MRTHGTLQTTTGAVTLALVTLAIAAGGCVPTPAGRSEPPSGRPTTSPAAVVPAVSPTPSGPTPLPSFVRPTPTALPSFVAYTVRAGDTLSSIARAFSTTPLSIAYWNRAAYPSLDPDSGAYAPDRIKIGWTLVLIPGIVIDGTDLPEVIPTAPPSAPAVSALPTSPAATATPGGAASVVRHGSRASSTVALTFDMGGRLDPALDILGWLVQQRVPATIFTTGETGTQTPAGRAALDIIAAHPEQFDLGNHSWSHPDFRDLDDAAMRDQLDRTETAVVAETARSTRPWFRPPYGGIDDQIPAVVGGEGWTYVVLWDVDTIDWRREQDGGPTTEEIVTKVVDRTQPGSIVLMHLGGYHTLEALPAIVGGLRARGLTLVTLGDMFGT